MKKLRAITTILAASLMSYNAMATSKVDMYLLGQNVTTLAEFTPTELQNINLSVVYTNQGMIYVDKEKDIILSDNEAFKIQGGELTSLNASIVDQYLGTIPQKIVAKAPNELAVVQIFTDISCSYCRQLHTSLQDYLDVGITIEFILSARRGHNTDEFFQMSTIAQRANQLNALQDMMHGEFTSPAKQPSDQMVQHQLAAVALKLSGTPTIYYQGYKIGGYLAAQDMLTVINATR